MGITSRMTEAEPRNREMFSEEGRRLKSARFSPTVS